MTDYIIVTHEDADMPFTFSELVNKKIAQGYIPLGGPYTYFTNVNLSSSEYTPVGRFEPKVRIAQAMIYQPVAKIKIGKGFA